MAAPVMVNQDYGGVNAMTYLDPNGDPIVGGVILAFLASDYTAGAFAGKIQAQTTTDSAGRWSEPMVLNPGSYVLVFSKQGAFSATAIALTVAAPS